jgi:hypothetical protein
MIFQRAIAERLRRLARQFPAVVLTGARQVGKTTLLRTLFPEHHWISLDLPSVAEQAERDPERFLLEHPAPAIIDEVQYAPQLFRFLKVEIDRNRHKYGQYLLTGSQKFVLMKEVADSMAGRAAILQLEPLSLVELGDAARSDWSWMLARGFYPELWRNPKIETSEFFSSYVATYLERDVRQILNVRNLRDFERFLRAVAVRSGQLLNMADLARDIGIKPHTARDWISVLEASNQLVLLEPYFENLGKRLIKSPKVYLTDPGLLCFLLGLNAASVNNSPLVGAIWETCVFAELRKQKSISADANASNLWFYRDSQGREIDFLRVAAGQIDLLEAKWSAAPDVRWHRVLSDVAQALQASPSQRIGTKTIVCRTAAPQRDGEIFVTNPRELERKRR